MDRVRTIAASPHRGADQAWEVVKTLVVDTLERSPILEADVIEQELAKLDGLVPAMIAGGHLEHKGLVLCDAGLHVTVYVVTADAALDVDENLNPVPGGAKAGEDWCLYVPLPEPYETFLTELAEDSDHISVDKPPKTAPAEAQKLSSAIDLDALRKRVTKW